MWRRLIARCHPDAGGSDDLFIWVNETLREHVTGDSVEPRIYERPRRTTTADDARVPFAEDLDHDALTSRALGFAGTVPGAYACLLKMLSDCRSSSSGRLLSEQRRGASYRRLAAIGHACGFDQEARVRWYGIAEEVPLSDRHAAHVLDKLRGQG